LISEKRKKRKKIDFKIIEEKIIDFSSYKNLNYGFTKET